MLVLCFKHLKRARIPDFLFFLLDSLSLCFPEIGFKFLNSRVLNSYHAYQRFSVNSGLLFLELLDLLLLDLMLSEKELDVAVVQELAMALVGI